MKKYPLLLLVVLASAGGVYFYLLRTSPASTNQDQIDPAFVANMPVKPARKVVNLSGKSLSSIDVRTLTDNSITELNINNNKLASLPPELAGFTKLQVLRLDNNKLQGAFLNDIGNMPDLRVLSAHGNSLTELPAGVGQLRQLVLLDLSDNNLSRLPPELSQLKNLKLLNLTGNHISASAIDDLKRALGNTDIRQ